MSDQPLHTEQPEARPPRNGLGFKTLDPRVIQRALREAGNSHSTPSEMTDSSSADPASDDAIEN